jgi:transcriptional regulator with XRE-family HTH domain
MDKDTPTTAWERRLAERYPTSEARGAFDHEVRAITATAKFIEALEEARKATGLNKTVLARRLGKSLPAVSRLTTAEAVNPTLVTVFELLDAMGLEMAVQLRSKSEESCPPLSVNFVESDISQQRGRRNSAAFVASV